MNALHRIIDANANRSREGLRVLEDIARFVLDRADLCERAKVLRHDVTAGLDVLGLDPIIRLASRDTSGDVGTTISTAGEYTRHGSRDISLAAAGRAAEALRCLEEAAKGLGQIVAARRFEASRYAIYTLEKDLVLSLPSGRGVQWKLCVLVTESLCTHHPWERIVELSIAGGADCIQLREKGPADRELLARARRLVGICHGGPRRIATIVNDRIDIAAAARADGVHLGHDDVSVVDARQVLGAHALIGVSASDLAQAHAAQREGADYIGLGAMFATTTKHKDSLAGLGLVREVLSDEHLRDMPHLAIGGIVPQRIEELWDAGVRGVAVSSAVCGAKDPEGVCRALSVRASSR